MANIWLARDAASDSPCVLKRMRASLENDPEAVLRFRREVLLHEHIDHPNVARILFTGEDQGELYFALELIAGQTLGNVLARCAERKTKVTIDIAIWIASGVLSGLQAL